MGRQGGLVSFWCGKSQCDQILDRKDMGVSVGQGSGVGNMQWKFSFCGQQLFNIMVGGMWPYWDSFVHKYMFAAVGTHL